MAWLFPDGILFDGFVYKILPGGYAVIGKCRTLLLSLVPIVIQVMLTLPLFSLVLGKELQLSQVLSATLSPQQ